MSQGYFKGSEPWFIPTIQLNSRNLSDYNFIASLLLFLEPRINIHSVSLFVNYNKQFLHHKYIIMSANFSITVPDHIYEIVILMSKQKRLSQSSACVFLMEKGISLALEETNKLEVVKKLITAREQQEKNKLE